MGREWLRRSDEFQASLGYQTRSCFKITHQHEYFDRLPILQKRAAKSHLLHKQKEYFTTSFFHVAPGSTKAYRAETKSWFGKSGRGGVLTQLLLLNPGPGLQEPGRAEGEASQRRAEPPEWTQDRAGRKQHPRRPAAASTRDKGAHDGPGWGN